ncbi:hypothetical protein [Dokdonella sp.]|uniref:hypothetical protein n=1 Tax=Dokdonella sp. TaxID=2291710 RepID=UPI003AF67FDA
MPPGAPDLPLRLAQRALAAALETRRDLGIDARRRAAAQQRLARRTLSALSADDRFRLERWLALQLATAPALAALARIDARLAARIEPLYRMAAAELARRNVARGCEAVTSGTSSRTFASPMLGLRAVG